MSIAFTDVSVPEVSPGSPEWFTYMTASKVSAIMKHSTYESYLSLWLKMSGQVQPQADTDVTRRGHYLEPAVRAWFRDQHPEWQVTETGMWVHKEIPWAASTPDGIVHKPESNALFEAKSSTLDHEWGEPGTDQVPPGYFDQAQWQMFTTGMRTVHLAVIKSYLDFAEYVIEYDAEYVALMLSQVTTFMDTLEKGQRPSIDPLDGHAATYAAIKELNPGIADETAAIGDDMAIAYLTAVAERKAAEYREQAAKSVIADFAGEAHYIEWNGKKIFTRQSRSGGTPYLVASKNLPTIPEESAAA
ncbi:lambda-exonuclease family protein [Arthrobacter sp. ISL-69]|uniref:lambda-exonuclease family protein n=1 Tax=Arthrobacter sp. ISL-69 TaxID=2819113 RepID=UPI001BE931FE|nr:YqaJ viral recombinase family protein [Arthrobacter sp. ISL-69]MBT2537251.1 YqaJ viral recombinase family protein [Arthrobacter sp. ISL-69]